jgi:Secretion system C-terminal sorting domain
MLFQLKSNFLRRTSVSLPNATLMKSSTLLTRFFLAGFTLVAGIQTTNAQVISYSSIANNVDMLVANIFGVQCEGVTNVQVNGAPFAVGRFDNGQGVGLNSGMMLSTGVLNYSYMASGYFASTQIGAPGDMDIINYGNLNGSGASSYDAVSVEFDFTPQVSDTIRFTYIFASEEYPEYSNSSFNDRFMFLVSENGGVPTNIATVPGTNTAVEINSINQVVNPQYYIDNMSAPSAAYFVFDGYTIPLQAKFYAQVGSTYHIKLVISDIADGVYDSAILLDEQESYNDISGQLTVNGSPAEGIIEVFNFSEDTLLATPVQTIPVTAGTYLADSLMTGVYHVRFTPDPVIFPGAVPLYFQTGSTWSTADLIGLPCYLNSADIDADTVNGYDGNATIFGNVIIDTSYLKMTVAFEGAYVQLKDQTTHQTVSFAWTDVNGDYALTGVPDGSFYILVDVPYIPQADTFMVTIAGGVSGEGFDYAILTEGIILNGEPSLGITPTEAVVFEMFPNPANEQLTVTLQGTEDQLMRLTTVNGQVVQQQVFSAGPHSVSTKGLASGVYLLTVGNSQPQRLIVQH